MIEIGGDNYETTKKNIHSYLFYNIRLIILKGNKSFL